MTEDNCAKGKMYCRTAVVTTHRRQPRNTLVRPALRMAVAPFTSIAFRVAWSRLRREASTRRWSILNRNRKHLISYLVQSTITLSCVWPNAEPRRLAFSMKTVTAILKPNTATATLPKVKAVKVTRYLCKTEFVINTGTFLPSNHLPLKSSNWL